MDFFYDPTIAASLAEYINYITPVPAAQADHRSRTPRRPTGDDKDDLETVATSPLVFPTTATTPSCTTTASFDNAAEQNTYENLFEPIVLS